jgi:hypothetical protein
MPNETYGLIVRAWTTTESLRVVVIVSYTFTTAPESNITLHPAEVEIKVRNKHVLPGPTVNTLVAPSLPGLFGDGNELAIGSMDWNKGIPLSLATTGAWR